MFAARALKAAPTGSLRLSIPCRFFSSSSDQIFQGTVTQYSSHVGYGFIEVDNTQELVFVHRNNLTSTIPLEKLPFRYPYLRAKERVSFTVTDPPKETDKHRLAAQVSFKNGKPIPAVRLNKVGTQLHRNNLYLGETLRKVMDNPDESLEEKWTAIQGIWGAVQNSEKELHDTLEGLGLNPKDYMGHGGKPQRRQQRRQSKPSQTPKASSIDASATSTDSAASANEDKVEEETTTSTSSGRGWGSV